MSQAAVFDTPALKWPFAARPSGAPRRAPPVVPARPGAPVTPPAAAAAAPRVRAGSPAARAPVADEARSLGGRAPLTVALSWRQKMGDVLLVAMWGAIIPGVLWFGHAAGF